MGFSSDFSSVVIGSLALIVSIALSIAYFTIRKYFEKLAELSAADLYQEKFKR